MWSKRRPKNLDLASRTAGSNPRRSFLLVVLATAGLAWAGSRSPAQDDSCDIDILPPHSTVFGRTLGAWSAEWWKWFLSIPADRHPAADTTGESCHEGQPWDPEAPVFFLAGTTGGPPVVRECAVPCDKYLFFPIVCDIEWFPSDACNSCPECRLVAEGVMDDVSVLEFEIDGAVVDNLENYRETSDPACFEFDAVAGNIFGIPPGVYEATSDGFWLMLEPLCPGPHAIHFHAVIGPPEAPLFQLDVTYHITVDPCGPFRRGDADGTPPVNLTDPVFTLNFLFLGGEAPACRDAADANDDGTINIADAVYTLNFLFLGGPEPPPPGPWDCGEDGTEDDLPDCVYDSC